MRFIRCSVKTTGLQIKPQGYITFVTRAAPLIRLLTITQINDITGLLSVPQYRQCNISIVFSNNAGRSEPLVLLLGELL